MLRVEKLINKVRYELSDLDKSRWSDIGLLGLLTDAQEDIVYKTNCLHKTITISTSADKNTYILPEDVRLLKSISFDNSELSLVTTRWMENFNKDWKTSVGNPNYAIYDNMDRGVIKITPIPSEPKELSITYLANPVPVLSLTDYLTIDASYDLGLFYYVVARALSRDFDAQDVNVGSRYMLLYDKEIKRFLAESSKSFLAVNRPFTSSYQGFV
jgi:hypothetical protein